MTYRFTKSLEHHGLVAGVCKKIDLANIIDQALTTSECRKVSFGNLFFCHDYQWIGVHW